MTAYESRLMELIDKVEASLQELREAIRQGPSPAAVREDAVKAFADEALRDRDA